MLLGAPTTKAASSARGLPGRRGLSCPAPWHRHHSARAAHTPPASAACFRGAATFNGALSCSLVAALSLALPEASVAALHAGQSNALSLPTWAIHVASVAEWLIAMDLVWRYGDAASRPEWKGLSWGMLPLHASSLCACTYHLFYNAPSLSALVTLQAGLTCFGNVTLAAAALRLARRYSAPPQPAIAATPGDSDSSFLAKTLLGSFAGGAALKYGSLLSDTPFQPSLPLALAIIAAGTAATGAALAARGAEETKVSSSGL